MHLKMSSANRRPFLSRGWGEDEINHTTITLQARNSKSIAPTVSLKRAKLDMFSGSVCSNHLQWQKPVYWLSQLAFPYQVKEILRLSIEFDTGTVSLCLFIPAIIIRTLRIFLPFPQTWIQYKIPVAKQLQKTCPRVLRMHVRLDWTWRALFHI